MAVDPENGAGSSLARILINTVKELSAYRAEFAGMKVVLSVALGMLADSKRRERQLVDQNRQLRAELRSVFTGRTIAEERNDLDQEAEMAA